MKSRVLFIIIGAVGGAVGMAAFCWRPLKLFLAPGPELSRVMGVWPFHLLAGMVLLSAAIAGGHAGAILWDIFHRRNTRKPRAGALLKICPPKRPRS